MSHRSQVAIDQEVAIVDAQITILRKREDELQKIIEDMLKMQESICAERLALEAKVIVQMTLKAA